VFRKRRRGGARPPRPARVGDDDGGVSGALPALAPRTA